MSEYLYYRWAGGILRHPPAALDQLEWLEARQWVPAPEEAINVIAALDPDEREPNAWCARLSAGEARRMLEAMSGPIT